MHKLNDIWTLWFHLPYDVDWSINSYKKICVFNDLEKCISLIENIHDEIVKKCMLFIMKNNIKPIWEDVNNNKGGCFSYKISHDIVIDVWKKLSYYLVGNNLTQNKSLLETINGISISPKKNYCIIKIWISNINDLVENEIYDFIKKYLNIKLDINDLTNNYEDPFNINELCNINQHQCIFKKHDLLY